ncbi:MAG: tripartite tricarboxylate transporter substrate-binding protein, partial [Casimicrobiaceae bacterium]
PLLYREVPFDPSALAPVSLLALAANVICVNAELPARNLKDLIALAKAQPGKLRYGSSGRGSSSFLTLELFKSLAGVDIEEVPYKSTSQAITETMGGLIDIYPPNIVSAISMLKSGRIRALAVTSAKRSSALPDVPAVGEFVPGYDATTGIYGVLVPAKTPKTIVDRLQKAIAEVSKDPTYRDKIEAEGGEVVGSTAVEYATYLARERDKWAGLFAKLGIKPQ